jgi:hypothetical protein
MGSHYARAVDSTATVSYFWPFLRRFMWRLRASGRVNDFETTGFRI